MMKFAAFKVEIHHYGMSGGFMETDITCATNAMLPKNSAFTMHFLYYKVGLSTQYKMLISHMDFQQVGAATLFEIFIFCPKIQL